ncbi:pirin family protein [Bacillus sp. NTK071]|uniref:pirin family protein n=1 Tax=Bacillus sp. NTK071 TaxID=2802175 RepID=UPI001A8DFA63|nr:pirin family protein [Bacillus sp. NTK071]MBN8207736.1 pirin family protein [Bacillus sp. NTK071]
MNIKRYQVNQQGVGQFDGGKITEQKPIGFPGEGSEVKRIGPLFYWAWAKSENEGYIPLHPHQGFEIITYVISGKAEHGDTLGTKSTVGPGGLQVMQTGSGVSHKEGFIGPNMQGFQIWFEPHITEALKRRPTYQQYNDEDFQVEGSEGIRVKEVLGVDSPVDFVTDAAMWDIEVKNDYTYEQSLTKGRSLSILVLSGEGNINGTEFQMKEFLVMEADERSKVAIEVRKDTRVIAIEVPTFVDYPMYRK